eukprot:6172481-Pyramimonas_sp.AAC.1
MSSSVVQRAGLSLVGTALSVGTNGSRLRKPHQPFRARRQRAEATCAHTRETIGQHRRSGLNLGASNASHAQRFMASTSSSAPRRGRYVQVKSGNGKSSAPEPEGMVVKQTLDEHLKSKKLVQ